ncbi:MAG TPA: type II toxin-antitoxin system RelE/ParE family toxin [Azospirillaceae bacterium]|nr:type II toxin-antitoxin system RelE/ParE family toxin [Azospirillaceae bacterium]
MKVRWRAAALDDIDRIYAYIEERNPQAAQRVVQELVVAGDSLVTFPYRGRAGSRPGFRELTTIWPYVIAYRVERNGTVVILRVWHGAQERA